MKKQFLSILLVVTTIFTLNTQVALALDKTELSIGDIKYISESQVEVPVIIENNCGIKGVSFDVQYGGSTAYSAQYEGVSNGVLFSDCEVEMHKETQENVTGSMMNGRIELYDSEHLYNANGVLCKLVFDVMKEAYDSDPEQDLLIFFSNAKIIDGQHNEVSVNFKEQAYKIHNKFNVSFNTNGGEKVSDIEYSYGDKITMIPTREEYDFVGWYKDELLTDEWNENDIVNDNITLYAKWIPKTQVISKAEAYIYDEKCTVNFTVCSKEATRNNTVIVQVNGENGQVAALKTQAFDTIDGELSELTVEIPLDELKCELGDNPTVDLMVWNPLSKGNNVAKMKSTFADEAYRISFNENYMGGRTTEKYIGKSSTDYILPDSKRTGYTFDCWTTSDGAKWESGTSFSKDNTLYAKYIQNEYKVDFIGVNGEKSTQMTTYNGILNEPEYSLDNYSLDGWYTKAGVKWDFSNNLVTDNMDLYLRSNASNMTVTYNTTAEASQIENSIIKYGDKIVPPEQPTREGCTFDGWYADSEYKSKFDFDNSRIYCDTTIYAKWLCNIIFDANEGTEVPSQIITAGGTVIAPTTTRENYLLVGWYDENGNKWIFDGENGATTAMKSTKLTARWVYMEYTVNFNANGGSSSMLSKKVRYKENYGTLPTANKDYNDFLGWYTAVDGGEKVSETTILNQTNDITVYAHWKLKDISGWTVASSVPTGAQTVETKYGYRLYTSRDSQSSLAGWTHYNTTSYWGPYGGWSDWQRGNPGESDSRQREWKQGSEWIDTSYNLHEYHYYCWEKKKGYCYTTNSAAGGSAHLNEIWIDYTLPWKKSSGGMDWYGPGPSTYYGTNLYFKADGKAGGLSPFERDRWISQGYTNYFDLWRYRDRSLIYTYHFYQDGESSSYPSAPGGCTIGNIVQYVRYRNK